MPRGVTQPKVKSAVELARSAGSGVAVASHKLKGGTHGKRGAARNRHERRSWRQSRRHSGDDE